MKKLITLLLLLCFLSCKEETKQYLHKTTLEVRFSNGEVDTLTCEYVNDWPDKLSYFIKGSGCLHCGMFYYLSPVVACEISTADVISDSTSVYKNK